MNITNSQIVKLFDDEGLSIEDIAEQFSLDKEAVKMSLAANSIKYRKLMKKDSDLFTDETLDLAVSVMAQCLFAEDENTKMRAAKFIINEKKGRHDVENIKNLGINVNVINMQMAKAREALKKSKNAAEQIIDVVDSVEQNSQLVLA